MVDWLVVADDRTGALEAAGELADRIGPVTVTTSLAGDPSTAGAVLVVDLASRHLDAGAAAARAARSAAQPARRRAHKIDSTLRGRWADELVAVQRVVGGRVLVVPALPRLGRTCVGGVVHVDGAALVVDDPRHGRGAARPADVLAAAGAPDVTLLADAAAVGAWLAATRTAPFAVADANTDDDLAAIGRAFAASSGVTFAGTSASIAAAAGAVAGAPVAPRHAVTVPARPVLVAVGSLHPVARAQLAVLHAAALADVEVLSTPVVEGRVAADDADRAASALACAVHTRLAEDDVVTLVVVGGDTTAAVLGDHRMVAGGTVAPGVPWSRRADGSGPLVVTKAGGFGNPRTLVELLTDEGR